MEGAYFEDEDAAEESEYHDYEAAAEHDGEGPFFLGLQAGFPDHLRRCQRMMAGGRSWHLRVRGWTLGRNQSIY